MNLTELFGVDKPVVGMVHLDALFGTPQAENGIDPAVVAAVRDAQRLASGGVDGLMIENYGAVPSTPSRSRNTPLRR